MTGSPRIDSQVSTGRGDDGTTGLLYSAERISKDDLRTEAYGTIDEAVAALGMARAGLTERAERSGANPALAELATLILRIQRELFVVGAEMATATDGRDKLKDGVTRVSAQMVDGLTELVLAYEKRIEMPREFIVPGETVASAALELGRTLLRRAERRAVALHEADLIPDGYLVPYLNRLADLAWILARVAEAAESRTSTRARKETSR